jgi:hypothetical protein
MKRFVRLTPRDARLLVRYLDGVDDVVTSRFIGGFDPHEDTLTHLLCEMLDDNFANLSTLPYPLQTLKQDLALEARPLRFSLAIEAKKYPPHVEGRVTFADLGVVVSYRDNVTPSNSFERGALFQAKRLHRSRHGAAFSLYDAFKEFKVGQLHGLVELQDGHFIDKERYDWRYDQLCFYLFFCPRPQGYDQQSQEDLRVYAIPTFHEHYFHHPECSFPELAEAHHALQTASDPTRHFPALLASHVGWLWEEYLERDGETYREKTKHGPLLARHVYERLWDDVAPLSWFLVYRMLLGRTGSCGENALRIARGEFDEGHELRVLPRYVVTLGIQVGTSRG